jgi:hypothetical protein
MWEQIKLIFNDFLDLSLTTQLIIICIICLLIYYFYVFKESDEYLRNKYADLYDESTGGYDDKAEGSMEILKKIKKPKAQDFFIKSQIMALNGLQGNLRNIRDKTDENQQIAMNIVDNQYRTLLAINRETDTNIGETQNNRTRAQQNTHMIDQIDNFAENNFLNLLPEINDEFWQPVVMRIEEIGHTIPKTQEKVINTNKEHAAKISKNKNQQVSNYLKLSETHTSDPQNVHDSAVIKDLNKTIIELRKTSSEKTPDQNINEIRQYIIGQVRKGSISSAKANKINKVLDNITDMHPLSSYNETEANLLKMVWDRTNHQVNAGNSESMKTALIDELANCMGDNGVVVCTTGRASRILGSLVLQDVNPILGAANTTEEYKNEVYRRCNKLIKDELTYYKNINNDNGLKLAAKSYDDPKLEVSEEDEERLKDLIKNKIDIMINEYNGKINNGQLERLRQSCYASL